MASSTSAYARSRLSVLAGLGEVAEPGAAAVAGAGVDAGEVDHGPHSRTRPEGPASGRRAGSGWLGSGTMGPADARPRVLAAAPALALAVAGLVPPPLADHGVRRHLVAAAPVVLGDVRLPARRRRAGRARWRAGATRWRGGSGWPPSGTPSAYTALDVISGVTAGYVTSRLPERHARGRRRSRWIFRIGTPVGEAGLVGAAGGDDAAARSTGVRRLRRPRRRAGDPAAGRVAACTSTTSSRPTGAAGMAPDRRRHRAADLVVRSDAHARLAADRAQRQPIRGDGRHSG